MIKILSQDGQSLYDLERANLFVVGNKLLISDKYNLGDAKAGCLGIYDNEQLCKEAFESIKIDMLELQSEIDDSEFLFFYIEVPTNESLINEGE